MRRHDRDAVGADLIRGIAVARDAVGADDDGANVFRCIVTAAAPSTISVHGTPASRSSNIVSAHPAAAAASRRRTRAATCPARCAAMIAPSAVPSPPVAMRSGVAVRHHVARRGNSSAPRRRRCARRRRAARHGSRCASARLAGRRARARGRRPTPGSPRSAALRECARRPRRNAVRSRMELRARARRRTRRRCRSPARRARPACESPRRPRRPWRALAHDALRQRPLIEIPDGVTVVPNRIHPDAPSRPGGQSNYCLTARSDGVLRGEAGPAIDRPIAAAVGTDRRRSSPHCAHTASNISRVPPRRRSRQSAVAAFCAPLRQSRQRCGSFSKPFSA